MVYVDLPNYVKYPIGHKFGSLIVKERVKSNFSRYICECDCGREVITTRVDLYRGSVFCCDECKKKIDENRTCVTCGNSSEKYKRDSIHFCGEVGSMVAEGYSCDKWTEKEVKK